MAMQGLDVADRALRAGTTVSPQIAAALASYLAVGATVGALFLMLFAAADRLNAPRPSSRPRPVVSPAFDVLALMVVPGSGAFFHAVDLVLLTPGETATVDVWARLGAGSIGFLAVAVGGSWIAASQARRTSRTPERQPVAR